MVILMSYSAPRISQIASCTVLSPSRDNLVFLRFNVEFGGHGKCDKSFNGWLSRGKSKSREGRCRREEEKEQQENYLIYLPKQLVMWLVAFALPRRAGKLRQREAGESAV